MSNGKKYFVPKFQRDYYWERENWEMLWEDIEVVLQSNNELHYMGFLILQPTVQTEFKIIDEQQRLTTIKHLYKKCFTKSSRGHDKLMKSTHYR